MAEAVADPDRIDQAVEPFALDLAPGDHKGSRMFSSALRTGSRLKVKDKADPIAPQLGQRAVAQISQLEPASLTVPALGRSSPASRCISVDLPEPEGPMIAAKRPDGKLTVMPARASTAASPSPKRRLRSRASAMGADAPSPAAESRLALSTPRRYQKRQLVDIYC